MGKILNFYTRIPLVSGGPGNWFWAKDWTAVVAAYPNAIVPLVDGGGYAKLADVATLAGVKADFRMATLSGGTNISYEEITDMLAAVELASHGPATTFTIVAGGSGWVVDDPFYVAGYIGSERLEAVVTSVSSGAITGFRVTKPGMYAASATRAITKITGSGTGATATIAGDLTKSGVIRSHALAVGGDLWFTGDTFTVNSGTTAAAGVVDLPDGGNHTAVPLGFQAKSTIAISSIAVATPGIVVVGDYSGLAGQGLHFTIDGSTSNDGDYGVATADFAGGNTTIKPTGAAVKATGTLTVQVGQPSPADTVTINGSVVTFVSGTPSGAQVQIGGNAATTAASMRTYVNINTLALGVTAGGSAAAVVLTANAFGTAGNAIGIASSAAGVVASAATLSGGAAGITFANDVTKGDMVIRSLALVGSDVTANFADATAIKVAGSTTNDGIYPINRMVLAMGVTVFELEDPTDLTSEDGAGTIRSGGAVDTYHLTSFGAGYTTGTKATTATGGAVGTGLTVSVTDIISTGIADAV